MLKVKLGVKAMEMEVNSMSASKKMLISLKKKDSQRNQLRRRVWESLGCRRVVGWRNGVEGM